MNGQGAENDGQPNSLPFDCPPPELDEETRERFIADLIDALDHVD